MKDQTSLIVIIVSLVAMIATLIVFYFQRTIVPQPANPAPIETGLVTAPEGAVAYTNSLPGGGVVPSGSGAAGGGAAGGGAPTGGRGGALGLGDPAGGDDFGGGGPSAAGVAGP